jgi:ketosteroid isomerase-like protein
MERIKRGRRSRHPNVELVLRNLDALSRTDLDAVMDTYDPDAELDISPFGFESSDGAVCKGRHEIRQAFEGVLEAWSEVCIEPHSLIDGGRQVLVAFHFWGRTASGIELEQDGAEVSTVSGGRIVREVIYPSASAALQAVAPAA